MRTSLNILNARMQYFVKNLSCAHLDFYFGIWKNGARKPNHKRKVATIEEEMVQLYMAWKDKRDLAGFHHKTKEHFKNNTDRKERNTAIFK